MKANPAMLQRQEMEEEELLQGKFESVQGQSPEKEKLLQGKFTPSETTAQLQVDVSEPENRSGMPHSLKAGLEALSGMNLSGIRVHNNSPKPTQLNALAYTQGQDIHVGPGQEKHLPHEGWHAVQQMQGRVKPTMQAKGVSINDDAGLEREADVVGAKALQMKQAEQATIGSSQQGSPSLRQEVETKGELETPGKAIGMPEQKVRLNFLYPANYGTNHGSPMTGVLTRAIRKTQRQRAVKLVQRQPSGAVKADLEGLRGVMERQIDLWSEASNFGIGDFVDNEILKRVDSLSQSDWGDLIYSLLGSAAWAAAAFKASPATSFAISMVKVAITGLPKVPKKSKETKNLEMIRKQMTDYIYDIKVELNNQIPGLAANLLKKHPNIVLDDATREFLKSSFETNMIIDDENNRPIVNEKKVRETMHDKAVFALDLIKQLSKLKKTPKKGIFGGPASQWASKYGTVALITDMPGYKDQLAVLQIDRGTYYQRHPPPLPKFKFVRWIPPEMEDFAISSRGGVVASYHYHYVPELVNFFKVKRHGR
ncbi:MAG: DUF4157 domain-containing protein [Proteobacteria bacterium]|nr:DUF4157 domain-containing protein [Pseudomonadota bacterium]